MAPLLNGFVEGFVTRRDFQPRISEGDVDRDSKTYGARAGVAIDPGGVLKGAAAVGLYRFDPDDKRIDARTGMSAQIGLIFKPLARTAFTLDGFIGNVATYRAGVQSREDRRVTLGMQQELRHNFRWQAGLVYRQSRYFGSGITESTYGAIFEAEYLVNRRLIVAGNLRYADRESTAPLTEFKRLRAGLELRLFY